MFNEKEYNKQWRKDNREKIKEISKRSYIKNREKILKHQKEYLKNNKEKHSECVKKWRKNNPKYNEIYYKENREKILEQVKEYRNNDPKKIKEIGIKYREKNRKKLSECTAEYRKNNPECQHKWREENPEYMNKYMRKWNKTEKGKANSQRNGFKKRNRMKNVINTLTFQEWLDILKKYKYSCFYCGKEFDLFDLPTRDHIVPIIKGGDNTKENVVPACRSCNSKKGAKSLIIKSRRLNVR